jgi:hypothetical protein
MNIGRAWVEGHESSLELKRMSKEKRAEYRQMVDTVCNGTVICNHGGTLY